MDDITPDLSDTGLTAQLAEFVANTPACPVSALHREIVRTGFVDTAAVMLAARDEPVTQIARHWVSARQGQLTQARILFSDTWTSARDAALVNGVAAHALDYDDVGLQGHPSAVLVPALLAEGERLQSPGAALMAAYLTGYEVWAELIARDRDVHHLKGWHPSGVFGCVASAAAVAGLRRLEVGQVRHALGLAASMASGLTANFGSMAKPFHVGQAAACGIDAVDLAQAGMTSAPDIFEHPKGFLYALSPNGDVDLGPPAPDFGKQLRFESLGLTVKKYPVCFAAHRIIDAALDLVHAHDVHAEQVQRVEATVGPAQASMLRNPRPTNALEAKFSLQFALAAPLVARACGLAEVTDDFVRRPDVQAVFELVEVRIVNTCHPTEPTLAASDRLILHLKDGRRLDSGEISVTRGDPSSPLQAEELRYKFEDCTRQLSAQLRERLWTNLLRLESLPDVTQLI